MASQEPTQPATQQVLDPRRVGQNNSGLDDRDIADVMLLLSPTTTAAMKIVERTARFRPEHVLFHDSMGSYGVPSPDIEEQETIIIGNDGKRQGRPSLTAADIALRLSSAHLLKSKSDGFIFGRNAQISDIDFGHDAGRRISNRHFRIFLNEYGLPMIEDMSTNGTVVDNVLLRGKDKRYNRARMLVTGTVITIPNPDEAEVIKFHVRIPSRGAYRELFEEHKRAFISECTTGPDREKALQRLQQRPYRATMKWDGGERYNIIGMCCPAMPSSV